MAMTLATNRTARFKNAALENAALENAALENAALENAALENAALENATLALLRDCPLPCQEASASERKLGCSVKSVCRRWFMPILRTVDAAGLNLDVELVTRNLCETFGQPFSSSPSVQGLQFKASSSRPSVQGLQFKAFSSSDRLAVRVHRSR
jgi:hypothetical protein